VLGLPPDATPLGREAVRRGLTGDVSYPLKCPQDFPAEGFELPTTLANVAFKPVRFVKGRIKSLCVSLCGERKKA